jgi:hypothetical protein
VATGFNRNNGLLMDLGMTILRPVARSPEKGAETLVWLATSPDVTNVSGAYFFDQKQIPPSPEAQDTETARWLWEISERQCYDISALLFTAESETIAGLRTCERPTAWLGM